MSRIGNKLIAIPSGVKVSLDGNVVTVEGKSKLSLNLPELVSVAIGAESIKVSAADDSRRASSMHGLARSLIKNMVVGVTTGYKKELTIVGVGYKAQLNGSTLVLNLGYSHPINFAVPAGIKITVTDGVKIVIEGADKQLVGETAAIIRRYRKPEPYKGKGIRYVDEQVLLKEGKSVG